jgi:pyridoxine 4-dehydrogenase
VTSFISSAAAAGSWRLGDLTVRRLGFGAMRLTGSIAFNDLESPPADRGQSIRVLRRAVELGVNHIDTAAFYFSRLRSANELISRALAPYPDDLVIAVKVGPGRDPSGEPLGWAPPYKLRGQVEENLRQLGRDYLDLVYLRVIGSGSIAEHFGELAQLQAEGLIRHLGVASGQLHQLAEARAIAPVVSVQNRFNIEIQHTAATLRACGEQGIAFVAYYSIAGEGREAGPGPETVTAAVQAVADAHRVTPAQVRLAWTLHQGPHVLVIPGTGNPAHLEENLDAGALRLSDAELTAISASGPQAAR